MKKVNVFLINFIFCGILFSQEINQSVKFDIKNEALKIITEFYSGNTIPSIDYAIELTQISKIENLEEFILSYTALSTLMTIKNSSIYLEKLELFEKEIKPIIAKTKDENILHLYSNYLYSKLSWEKSNYKTIETLPNIYQKNAFYSKNKQSLLDMAIWYIFIANTNTSIINAFITKQEKLIENISLTDVEKFNTYINYSIFYMKTYNTKKSFYYLDKAKKIFPNGIITAIIETNYKNGKVGW